VLLVIASGWLAQPAAAGSCPGFQIFFGTCTTTPPTTKPAAPAPAPAPAPVTLTPATPAPVTMIDTNAAAAHMLDLVNAERAGAGMAPMTMRADLVSIALGQSQAMAAAGSIWHNANYLTSATRAAVAAKAMGENVAMHMSTDAAHAALMNSPGHRANILNPVFTVVGIAIVQDPRGALYFTQDFIQPSGGTPRGVVAAKPAAVKAAPRAPAAPRPKPAAPASTAAPTTAAPDPTTTTAAPTTTAAGHIPVFEGEFAAATLRGTPATDGRTAGLLGFAVVLLLTVGLVGLRAAMCHRVTND
jgi:uncharacterized protein YkwD